MKLLRDRKIVEGIQELIANCRGKVKPTPKTHAIQKMDKIKKQIGCKMRLTSQIIEYEMEQVILNLGLDANVLSKKTWEGIGIPALQWSPFHLCISN